jgi:acetyl-CoA carboxylase biotin carboxylase subunit
VKRQIKRVFVANRGEIAVRVIHACRSLGLQTVVGVSEADRQSLAASLADRAVCIGASRAADSYLKMETVIHAALGTGCDAIHPGYGFLSERAAFQRLCEAEGLIFIGPRGSAIEAMGDKLNARALARNLGVPVVTGSDHVASAEEALEISRQIGYPFLLKARAGGGGKGMRVVRNEAEVASAFENASAEAYAAFGDRTLYIERYIEQARHIEVQVLGDEFGNVIHLGERDCSAQRRHQKLIEEAPSPVVDASMRREMTEAATAMAHSVRYNSAGTVEFIFDPESRRFYFLEMNTRIQVEHPVTEMITGIDIVAEQIKIASGERLMLSQRDIHFCGHAIECRINAEDPTNQFMPCPGRITRWNPPEGEGVRVDTHCFEGYLIPPFYDSMVAKLIVHGEHRKEAIDRLLSALSAFEIEGIRTTIPFHQRVLCHPDFQRGQITTTWVEKNFLG